MENDRSQFLVETAWLAEHLLDSEVRVVDMRGYVRPVTLADGVQGAEYVGARGDYEQGHIPGAVYIDWSSDIIDPDDDVEAQIAPPERFAEAMSQAGIGDNTLVVAYADLNPQFATRLWWALNYYGHSNVVVLNGGYPKWVSEKRPLEKTTPTYEAASFSTRTRPELRATAEQVLSQLRQDGVKLVDARDEGQYSGTVVRGHGRPGHIPGAINIPREELVDFQTGVFRSNAELKRVFEGEQVEPGQHVVAYCNGGVAATIVLFSLAMLGYPDLTNYDGSWNEWGVRQDLPTEV